MNYRRLASSENREEWLEARRRGVTATDVARLMHGGRSVWATVKAEKAGETHFTGNAFTAWGIEREPVIAKTICAEYPVVHNTDLLQSVEDERWLATPDLLDPNGSLVGDVKTAVWKGKPWSEPPPNYYSQLQWQMAVTGIREAILCVEYHQDFVPTSPFPHVLTVSYDPDHVAELVEVAESFLAMGDPSPFDLYLADYARVKQVADAAAAELEEVTSLIRKEIGERDNFKFVSDAGSISLTTPKPAKRFDAKALESDDPDLYSRYVKESQGKPRLTIRAEGVA